MSYVKETTISFFLCQIKYYVFFFNVPFRREHLREKKKQKTGSFLCSQMILLGFFVNLSNFRIVRLVSLCNNNVEVEMKNQGT